MTLLLGLMVQVAAGLGPSFHTAACDLQGTLPKVRLGNSYSQVVAMLGKPSYTVAIAAEEQLPEVGFVAKYGADSRFGFASLASVYFDKNRRVQAVYGANAPRPPRMNQGQLRRLLDLIDLCPGFCGETFRADRLVAAVDALRHCDRETVFRVLRYYLAVRPTPKRMLPPDMAVRFLVRAYPDEEDYRIVVLLRTLFQPIDPGVDEQIDVAGVFAGATRHAVGDLALCDRTPVMLCAAMPYTNFDSIESEAVKQYEARGRLALAPQIGEADAVLARLDRKHWDCSRQTGDYIIKMARRQLRVAGVVVPAGGRRN